MLTHSRTTTARRLRSARRPRQAAEPPLPLAAVRWAGLILLVLAGNPHARIADARGGGGYVELDELERLGLAAAPGPWVSWIEDRDHHAVDSFMSTRREDLYPKVVLNGRDRNALICRVDTRSR